jgi:hypothetical protein
MSDETKPQIHIIGFSQSVGTTMAIAMDLGHDPEQIVMVDPKTQPQFGSSPILITPTPKLTDAFLMDTSTPKRGKAKHKKRNPWP